MKALISILTLVIILISCESKTNEPINNKEIESKKEGITIGHTDNFYSKVLQQDRELLIYTPESYKNPNTRREQYPVVYLLDAEYNFASFITMLQIYSEMNDTKILPEMVVVGIKNIDFNSRMMDFSPTTSGAPKQFGGGSKFLDFIESEVIPYAEKNYAASQNRTIIGHSFGGIAVMSALTQKPELFDNYLIIDGSLDFDNELFLSNNNYQVLNKDLKDKKIYVALANTATYGSTLESIKTDTITSNKYVRYSLELIDQLKESKTPHTWKYYKDDTHGSIAYEAQRDAMRYFYNWFEFKKDHLYRGKYYKPTNKNNRFANLTKEHFKNVSDSLGFEYKPHLKWLNESAYSMHSFHKQSELAIETYNLAIDYYPNNPKSYSNLATFYIELGDTLNAKKQYQKAIDHTENIEAKNELTAFVKKLQ